jgi:aromatic-L-amino-acid/L-tryptophan decarboxylase
MPGDLPPDDFRSAMHRVADLVANYLEGVGDRPVLPPVAPGEVGRVLPAAPPEEPEPIETVLDDYLRVIEPNLTHWNHPGFLAYFAITGSGPGILGETLAAALNVNAMLWRTSPAATELEERVCAWLGQMMGLPAELRGHINDTASSSSLVALAAARHRLPGLDVRVRGLAGRPELPPLVVYASDQAHSSIDKAAIVLGIGQENVRRVESDGDFRLSVAALAAAITRDRTAGRLPMAVVATVGTTSTTSVDPVPEIADLCAREGVWLHVDAAYAGPAALCPEYRELMPGLDRADSLVVNPHKWLFTPVDCSVLFVRDPALLKDAFSLVPEYLRTAETEVTNLMDYGFQLGRRFRALKLWMVIRAFGVEGLRQRIREHCSLARGLADRIAGDPRFELAAPMPFSAVCFRALVDGPPETQDRFNERLLARLNAAGPFFLSHTVLRGRYTLRAAIGNLRTGREHVEALWNLLGRSVESLREEAA